MDKSWLDQAIHIILLHTGLPTVIVVGSVVLSLIIVVAVLYFESKIKNRKDKDE